MAESRPSPDAAWSWKTDDTEANAALRLRYEPGGWGDILKGAWALSMTRALCRSRNRLRYLDPFAGARSYPLTEATSSRLEWLGSGPYVRAQAAWNEQGQLASTASLVLDVCEAESCELEAAVFDTDDERLSSWVGVADVIETSSGDEALLSRDADWALVDPYDLADRWPALLPAIRERARESWVLLYLYNRSPRGGGHERNYQAFRRQLEAAVTGELTIGRVPSDIHLPRAFHEVILSTPGDTPAALRSELDRTAKALTCKLSTSGATETRRARR